MYNIREGMTIMYPMQLRKVSSALALASLLGVGAALLAPAPAHAGSTPTNLAVTANIAANCTISTTAVAFGAYDPVVVNAATALNGTGTVTIGCTKGSAPNITLGLGANASGSQRNMLNGANTDVLGYQLYQPPNNTPGTACPAVAGGTVWGTTGANIFTPTVPASKNTRAYNICGVVSAGQDVSVGSYSDTVVATVNF
ncbi:MAG TPA: spore coat U domain-containing protein [Casimicrobiaceae bacterium]|nr:spore coat U domain-containing protein [Casimicrobiaceae bacterium]